MVQSPRVLFARLLNSYIDNVDDWIQALNDRNLTVTCMMTRLSLRC